MALKHHRPYAPTTQDRAMLSGPGDVAAIRTSAGVLTATASGVHSAVMQLVQGTYAAFPGRAHALLRTRILTTAAPCERDHALVQVAAKRLTAGVSRCEPHEAQISEGPTLDVSTFARRARAIARRRARLDCDDPHAVDALARSLPGREGRLADQDRAVVAVLVGPSGEVLLACRNTAARNKTLHDEINLVQGWWARSRAPLPDGCTVYVSLQPCRMCAAWLAHAAGGRLTVCYAEPDPGRFARGTALQRGGPAVEAQLLRK